ncbi:two tm domain ATPase [Entamoeba histolytica]|uniref:Two tm domain ATPase n=1 Tax=Entamoeba histolytica TaxID=5759 RepID=A0A175JIX6_ENTHI|nr:two tm domain ATPase [Entamoeba histolytica]
MQLLLIIIGWIFALIFLFNNSIKEYPILRSLIKSLPIIFDILFISIQYSTSFEVYMIIGLIWCCLGDFVLEYSSSQLCFLIGTFSFIVAHCFNSLGFFSNSPGIDIGSFIIPFLLTCVVFVFFLLSVFSFKIQLPLKVGCLFYATIIVTAFYSSLHFLFNSNQYNLLSRFLCSIGYFYFVLSDLILFQMVFNKPSSLKRFWCMITYYIAQSLLCVGTVMTMNVQPSFLRNIN